MGSGLNLSEQRQNSKIGDDEPPKYIGAGSYIAAQLLRGWLMGRGGQAAIGALLLHFYPMMLKRGFSASAMVAALTLIGPAQV